MTYPFECPHCTDDSGTECTADESPDGYGCTRPAGHDGPHIACAGPKTSSSDLHNLATWDDEYDDRA